MGCGALLTITNRLKICAEKGLPGLAPAQGSGVGAFSSVAMGTPPAALEQVSDGRTAGQEPTKNDIISAGIEEIPDAVWPGPGYRISELVRLRISRGPRRAYHLRSAASGGRVALSPRGDGLQPSSSRSRIGSSDWEISHGGAGPQ